jgi:flagellar biosynthesis protein FliQ
MILTQDLLEITKEALLTAAAVSLPIVGAAVLASLISALLQSFSKVSDASFSTLPRIVLTAAALVAAAPWIGARAAAFAEKAWSLILAVRL